MMLKDQVFSQALLLAGELDEHQTDVLHSLCGAFTASLAAKLKEGLMPEDCKADFIAAASLYALASLSSIDENVQVQEFKAGDLTVKKSSTAKQTASECLERQAERMIAPYLKDRFAFVGV